MEIMKVEEEEEEEEHNKKEEERESPTTTSIELDYGNHVSSSPLSCADGVVDLTMADIDNADLIFSDVDGFPSLPDFTNLSDPENAAILQDERGREPGESEVGGTSGGGGSDDLAVVFFEWLKSNKETISPEDLKNIKLKRSTIECAVRRLGGGKEGMKQLLKLILSWVQNHHLEQKRRLRTDVGFGTNINYQQLPHLMIPVSPPASVPFSDEFCNWVCPIDPIVSGFNYGAGGVEMSSPVGNNEQLHAASESIPIWPTTTRPPQFPLFPVSSGGFQTQSFFGQQYPIPTTPSFFRHNPNSESYVRFGSSATKEARKKRMARQRRFISLHNHRQNQNLHHHHQFHQQQQEQCSSSSLTQDSGMGVNSWPVKGLMSNIPTAPNSSQQQVMQQIQQQQVRGYN